MLTNSTLPEAISKDRIFFLTGDSEAKLLELERTFGLEATRFVPLRETMSCGLGASSGALAAAGSLLFKVTGMDCSVGIEALVEAAICRRNERVSF